MMTPVVGDPTWRERFGGLPAWRPAIADAVVVSPHPDDETLGTGGSIAWLRGQGVRVTVVAVTDGEHAYADGDPLELAAVRRAEQARALARLGVAETDLIRLGLPDSGVAGCEQVLTQRLLEIVTGRCHVFAPWEGDFHPDHEACGRAAKAAAAVHRARLTSYFFWTWHRGTLETVAALPLMRFPLDEDLQQAKQEALACHVSQLEHAGGGPVLPAELLGPAAWPYEVLWPR